MRYGWVVTRGRQFVGACMNELEPDGRHSFRVRKWLNSMAARPDVFIHACDTRAKLVHIQAQFPRHVPQDRPKQSQ
jgi:hypothetical protein